MLSCSKYLSLLISAAISITATAAGAKKSAPSFEKEIKPLFQKYCYDCHGDGMKKGGLALDEFHSVDEMIAARNKWQMVARNVHLGEMPPPKKEQPNADERELMTRWIDSEIFKVDCDNPDPGRVTIRRLNRAEYNNTIRDLVGVDFQPADDFPVDDVGYGFDNIGDVLSVSPVLFEKYLAAAEKILDHAIRVGPPVLSGPIQKFEAEKLPSTAEGGGPYGKDFAMALMKEGEVFTNVSITASGDYFIRIRAFGQQAGSELPKLEIRLANKPLAVKEVAALENSPEIYEIKTSLEPGEKKIAAAYIN